MGSFWQIFWLVVEVFLLVAYLIFLFQIVSDLLRDTSLGGGAKALWMIILIALPLVSALAYLLLRGGGMEERRREAAAEELRLASSNSYGLFGNSVSHEISSAFTLLEDGAITQEEYDVLKSRIISA